MTKAELMELVGQKVHVYFKSGERAIYGVLNYVDEFSAKHNYRMPNHFYIGNTSFLPSHVRKVEIDKWINLAKELIPIMDGIEREGEP